MNPPSFARLRSRLPWLILPLLLLARIPGAAPRAAGEGAAVAEVDSIRILATARHLSEQDGEPVSRWAPLPGTAAYAAYLRDRLAEALAPLGGTAALDTFYPGLAYDGPHEIRTAYTNVIGRVPGALGTASPGLFLVGAHFDGTSQRDALADTTWDPFTAPAPGADDNGSGVATILEAVRVMAERGLRPQADLMVAFFDGEEQQLVEKDRYLLGSTFLADSVFAAGKLGARDLYGFINLDMVSYNPRRDSLVVLTNVTSRWLANHMMAVHREGAAPGLDLERLVQGRDYSDHAPFWRDGYDAVLLIEGPDIEEHNPHYHRSSDTVENTYSRNGSQAKRAAELLLGMFTAWARTDAADLVTTADDILVTDGFSVDLATVAVGDPGLTVRAAVTNRGGTRILPWTARLDVETLDGRVIRSLGTQTVSEPLPAGGRQWLEFPWAPQRSERGAVRLVARVVSDGVSHTSEGRVEAVEGSPAEVPQAFVFPNPTRDPRTATVRYQLTREGAVRLSVLGLDGQLLAEKDLRYDAGLPGPDVRVGVHDVALRDVLAGGTLAPGLYLVRVELFGQGGGSADVSVAKMVVTR